MNLVSNTYIPYKTIKINSPNVVYGLNFGPIYFTWVRVSPMYPTIVFFYHRPPFGVTTTIFYTSLSDVSVFVSDNDP